MKTTPLVLCVLAIWEAAAWAEIGPGSSMEQVRQELGVPSGHIQSGGYQLFYYERGKVELRDGVVVTADLMTPEELAATRERDRMEREKMMARAESARAQRLAEGRARLAQVLSDPAYASWSATEQVSFWRDFQRSYPEVPVGRAYADALKRYEAELLALEADLNRQREIAILEARLREAEERAAAAEQRSHRLENCYGYYSYPVVYVSPPVVCPPISPPRCRNSDLQRKITYGASGLTLTTRFSSSLLDGTTLTGMRKSSVALAGSF